ncbi:MAG: cyclic nucleotide-binding domain-containing protein [Anaerolineales bacterium]
MPNAMMEVDRRTQQVFSRLRAMHLFRGLADEQIVEQTRLFERETPEPNAVLCEEGKTGLEGRDGDLEATQWLYIVDKGRVRLSRAGSARTQLLEPGDFFGVETLITPKALHPFTVTAIGAVNLLKLKQEDFDKLCLDHEYVEQAARLMAETRAALYQHPWVWLPTTENVYLITRRHRLVLAWRELFPGVAALLLWVGVAGLWVAGLTLFASALAVFAFLALAWVVWVAIDWGNDYFIVTHQRVVYVEKVVLIYDSRVNLSVSALTAVSVESGNVADRLLDYGNVEIKTISKPMLLDGIPYPPIVAAIIEEQIGRLKNVSRETEVKLLRDAIRDRINPPLPEPQPPTPPAKPKPREPLGQQLRQLFSIQLRYEEGDTIVYRKHWWFLLLSLAWPSLALLIDVGLIGTALAGLLVLPEPLSPAVVMLLGFVFFIVLFAWWMYEFQDWRNDLYQVSSNQIVDVNRKPLGRETKDSAELDKIQGLESQRPNLIGRLLNFGNVRISIVGKELSFDDVYDPLSVQEDIQRRIEAFKARRNKLESRRRREELVDLLSAYYLATQELPPRGGEPSA